MPAPSVTAPDRRRTDRTPPRRGPAARRVARSVDDLRRRRADPLTSPPVPPIRWSASAATSRARRVEPADVRVTGDEPHLVACLGQPALDQLIASTTTAEALPQPRPPRAPGIRGRTAGWTIASRSSSATGSAKTIRPSAARSSEPSAGATPRRTARRRRRAPARLARRPPGRPESASMTTTPGRSPSQPATVDFPQPIGPVIPIRTVTARDPELEPGVLGSRQRHVDIRQLAGHPPHLHEVPLHRRIPHRQFEVILPQPKPRQLPLGYNLLPPIRLLGELLLLPTTLLARGWWRCALPRAQPGGPTRDRSR